MRTPAYITTWGEVKKGQRVLVTRRSASTPSHTLARIDKILDIEPTRADGVLHVKASKEIKETQYSHREVEYLADRDMLVAVVDSG